MSGIGADVRDIVRELDPDGGGYQTSEAASLLIHRYITAGICNADGDPKPKVKALMRLGAGVAFKNYKADSHEHAKKTEKAYAYGEDGDQRDFSEMYEDFAFEWLRVYAAWDEGDTAERKMLIRMTLPEILAVIALKRKKAAEATAVADRLQDIIDGHPKWRANPSWTLADVLGLWD
jgi:hypothetical protein